MNERRPLASTIGGAAMVRLWRDLDRRIAAEEITTAKAAELFVEQMFTPPAVSPIDRDGNAR